MPFIIIKARNIFEDMPKKLNSKQEEGNALTAVGDEIRSRSAAAKKEAAKTEQVDKKVPSKGYSC